MDFLDTDSKLVELHIYMIFMFFVVIPKRKVSIYEECTPVWF